MRLLREIDRVAGSTYQGYQIASAVSMGASFNGIAVDVEHTPLVAIQVKWSAGGAPVGTLQLQGSINGVDWFNVVNSGATKTTLAIASNAGDDYLTDPNAAYLYARVIYTRTSGTATFNAWAEAKGF